VRALRGERTAPLPVWFMRQAGRSLPEYRAIRENVGMLESCLDPELAIEITLQPVRRHNVDAAIFFSDIVIPLRLAGVGVEIVSGVGPVIENPVRTRADFERLNPLETEALTPIAQSVSGLVANLGQTPLIGFGGAPFTLASYLIEGGPSRELPNCRAMMANEPELWADILNWCADITAKFISAQVKAGASALQVFDSWAGRLTRAEYLEFAAPHTTRLFDQLKPLASSDGNPVARIHFGVGTGAILKDMFATGATAMGVDSATSLADAAKALDFEVPLQGNIDTSLLTAEWSELAAHAAAVVELGKAAPGHVVNLGHGVPADTDPDVLTKLVALIHELSSAQEQQ
jgi:uroporphyrinogen decarboxylase